MRTRDKRIFRDGLWDASPVTFQILGICSALAVTLQTRTAVVMGAALTFVLCVSNITVSILRDHIPSRIRIIVQLLIISTFVIVVDLFLQAYFYDIAKELSIFVALIITNCIVMGRAEGFAMRHPPRQAFWDGLGNGLGYSAVLIVIAVAREFLGQGSVAGVPLVPEAAYRAGYVNCGIMLLAPGAFFLLGAVIWIQRAISGYVEK